MRDLLTESGSIFVQIGDENVHRVRAVMDEVFGAENFVRQIAFKKTGGSDVRSVLTNVSRLHSLVCQRSKQIKVSPSLSAEEVGEEWRRLNYDWIEADWMRRRSTSQMKSERSLPNCAALSATHRLTSAAATRRATRFPVSFEGRILRPTRSRIGRRHETGMSALAEARSTRCG